MPSTTYSVQATTGSTVYASIEQEDIVRVYTFSDDKKIDFSKKNSIAETLARLVRENIDEKSIAKLFGVVLTPKMKETLYTQEQCDLMEKLLNDNGSHVVSKENIFKTTMGDFIYWRIPVKVIKDSDSVSEFILSIGYDPTAQSSGHTTVAKNDFVADGLNLNTVKTEG